MNGAPRVEVAAALDVGVGEAGLARERHIRRLTRVRLVPKVPSRGRRCVVRRMVRVMGQRVVEGMGGLGAVEGVGGEEEGEELDEVGARRREHRLQRDPRRRLQLHKVRKRPPVLPSQPFYR